MYRVYCDQSLMFETEDYELAKDYARDIARDGYTGMVKELIIDEGVPIFQTSKVTLPDNKAIRNKDKRLDMWG